MRPTPARPRRLLLAALACCATSLAPGADLLKPLVPAEFAKVVAADATLQQLASGLRFTEGPVWVPRDGGYLLFSDIPANEIKRWSAAGGLSTWRTPSNNANGNVLAANGDLITCEHGTRRVTRTDAAGTITVLAESLDGKRLNSPNDVAVGADGGMWFTDPPYGLGKNPKEQAANHVFRRAPDGALSIAVADFDMPNGICLSPDGKRLYVADSGKPRHIRVFTVAADQSLSDGKVFAALDQGAPDGIRCDREGRVWSSAGDGARVYLPSGEHIGTVLTPESPANLCFGGAKGTTLFLTARTSLYAVETLVGDAGIPKP